MPIGEFATRSGLSPRRLRSYAATGLLPPAGIDPSSGYRYYSPGQLRDARLIDALREGGMPLAEIGGLLSAPSARRLDVWRRQVEAEATERGAALDRARDLLAAGADPAGLPDARDPRKEPMTTLNAAARTEVGPVRDNNEDAHVVRHDLMAVADGMGGGPGGEVASAMAVALVESAFTGQSLVELQAAVRAANRAIWEQATASSALHGMGTTTCAVGVVDDGALAVVNVGDSRAYLFRDGVLSQLTEDHSITGELIRRGQLGEEEVADHPHHGVLTRVLGVGPTVEVDGTTLSAGPGDRLLVCTDGLFNEVAREEIATLLGETQDAAATADALVEAALSRRGRDNVTAIVTDVMS